jgi:hypothetical protein
MGVNDMADDPQYFQMQITIGIEAQSLEQAEEIGRKVLNAVAVPLYANNTPEGGVFETFYTQVYDYPDDP